MLRQSFAQKYVSCMGRGNPHGHDNKISRHSPRFMITRIQLQGFIQVKNRLLSLFYKRYKMQVVFQGAVSSATGS